MEEFVAARADTRTNRNRVACEWEAPFHRLHQYLIRVELLDASDRHTMDEKYQKQTRVKCEISWFSLTKTARWRQFVDVGVRPSTPGQMVCFSNFTHYSTLTTVYWLSSFCLSILQYRINFLRILRFESNGITSRVFVRILTFESGSIFLFITLL